MQKKLIFRGGLRGRGRGRGGFSNFNNKPMIKRNVDSKKVLVNPSFFREKMNMNNNGTL